MAGMDTKHCKQSSVSHVQGIVVSRPQDDAVEEGRSASNSTYHGKEVLSRPRNIAILGHNSNGQTGCYEDENGLENMCHHLALLDIRLRYPHVVFVGVEGRGKTRRKSVNRQLPQPCGYVNTSGLRWSTTNSVVGSCA
jgi:hypothetical protein